MKRVRLCGAVAVCGLVALFVLQPPLAAQVQKSPPSAKKAPAPKKEEPRCTENTPLRMPLFGETHTHTAYSFDAYSLNTTNRPADAYRYAKGERIYIADEDGVATRCAQLSRPLDFAVVTDHSEFLGAVSLCLTPGSPQYDSEGCRDYRTKTGETATAWGTGMAAVPLQPPAFCGADNQTCHIHSDTYWQEIQNAAEEAYDRSPACKFTTFVGYEWTSSPNLKNRHRNVIFRNEHVPELPLSVFETTNDEQVLWDRLQRDCRDPGHDGCDVITIPHNGNLSDGQLYTIQENTQAYALKRSSWEPLSEIHQGKGNSECRTGVGTEDPECGFEQLTARDLGFVEFGARSAGTKRSTDEPFAPNSFLRNVLKMGIDQERKVGANPFKLGFAGGTDTHSALPGGTDEGHFQGLHGDSSASAEGLLREVEFNPGALTVVWAKENSRDAIFNAMQRRETYATSGTRPIVRLFAGWNLPTDLCSHQDFVAEADKLGVPMGSDIPGFGSPGFGQNLRIAVMAMKDPGGTYPPPGSCAVFRPSARLQRIEIVKGWVDSTGMHEKVVTVIGDPVLSAEAGVTDTCTPVGPGHDTLCTVWTDTDYPTTNLATAFYYARVLENPSCRWSTYTCQDSGLNPFKPAECNAHLATFSREPGPGGVSPYDLFKICCNMVAGPTTKPTEISRVIQERAWTSPVWYRPPFTEKK